MSGKSITEDEAKLYDRQIRVWGVEAQNRMRNANILMVGCGGLAAETLKNVVLAGVGSVTIVDERDASAAELCTQFFLRKADVGKNRAQCSQPLIQRLNPNVLVKVDTESVERKADHFFHQFNVVCLTDCTLDEQLRINAICRAAPHRIAFFTAHTMGMFSQYFVDLLQHEYVIELDKGTEKERKVQKSAQFTSLQQCHQVPWPRLLRKTFRKLAPIAWQYFSFYVAMRFQREHGEWPSARSDPKKLSAMHDQVLQERGLTEEQFPLVQLSKVLSQADVHFCGTTAIMGGLLAQDVLCSVAGVGAPSQNVVVLDTAQSMAVVKQVRADVMESGAPVADVMEL